MGELLVPKTLAAVALLLLGALSCAPRSGQASRTPLTGRQRDSVLARSILPGAPVVGRAMEVSDRAAVRAAGADAADSLFH
jgi:hypothetical protein